MYSGHPIGTIIMFPSLNLPKDYLLCNGDEFHIETYSELAQILGSDRLPNMTNRFPRGVGSMNDNKVLNNQSWKTGMPTNAFKIDKSGKHTHKYNIYVYDKHAPVSGSGYQLLRLKQAQQTPFTWPAGKHSHVIGGGDAETRPNSISVYFIIKAL